MPVARPAPPVAFVRCVIGKIAVFDELTVSFSAVISCGLRSSFILPAEL